MVLRINRRFYESKLKISHYKTMEKDGFCIKLYASVNAANDYALSVSTCFSTYHVDSRGGCPWPLAPSISNLKHHQTKNISPEDVIANQQNHFLNSGSQTSHNSLKECDMSWASLTLRAANLICHLWWLFKGCGDCKLKACIWDVDLASYMWHSKDGVALHPGKLTAGT